MGCRSVDSPTIRGTSKVRSKVLDIGIVIWEGWVLESPRRKRWRNNNNRRGILGFRPIIRSGDVVRSGTLCD